MRDFFVYSSFSLDLDIFRTLKHSIIISIVMCTVTRNDVIRKILKSKCSTLILKCYLLMLSRFVRVFIKN